MDILLRSDSAVECRGVGSGQFSSFRLIPLTFYLCFSLSYRRKKARLFRVGLSCIWSLVMSYFHIANATLSSALFRFTTEFGMGSGGSKTLLSPRKFFSIFLLFILKFKVFRLNLEPGNVLLSHSKCYTIIGAVSFHY